MIDRASEEQLKNSIDIVDIISNYIEIKKAGANFKANCPFHGEKTPSFVISPTKQIFHCFGCGVGGDAIQFVMEYEKLNYPEALEKIASIMNVSLQYTQGKDHHQESREILEKVQRYYTQNLQHHPTAHAYLKQRGITQASIEAFGIGYVGKSYELINFLQQNFLSLPTAQEAGIIAQREGGGFYARLSERITFPIHSPNGSLVGFGGRTITNHPAKYINSPQTKLFNKSRLLYGYAKAKTNIYRNKKLIICEGYLDVIMLHQAGFTEAVATLGTALTQEHLPLLRKGEPKIILAYDGDKAGVAAALKAAIMLSHGGFDGSVVLFPNGQDPAEMIAKGEIQNVANLLRAEQPLTPFVLEQITKSHDLNNPRDKEHAFHEINAYLDKLSPIIRDAYLAHAATLLGISVNLFEGASPPTSNTEKKKKTQQKSPKIDQPHEDIAQLSILKNLHEEPHLIEEMSEVLEPSIFGNYSKLFEALQNREFDHPQLMALALDEEIKLMPNEELRHTLACLLFRHYTHQLREVSTNPNLPLRKKGFLIRKIKMDLLPRLQKGELVAYKIE